MAALKETLTADISAMYQRELEMIDQQPTELRSLAWNVLSWIFRATRPLHLTELIEALAVEPGDTVLDPDNRIREPALIVQVCRGFVRVDGFEKILRFSHEKFKHHLESNPPTQLLTDVQLAETCLAYLTFDNIQFDPLCSNSISEVSTPKDLLEYAGMSWDTHLRRSNCYTKPNILASLTRLSSMTECLNRLYGFTFNNDWQYSYKDEHTTILHLFIRLNFVELLELWLSDENHRALLKAEDDEHFTPLILATHTRLPKIVMMLSLCNPSSISAPNSRGWTAMHQAVTSDQDYNDASGPPAPFEIYDAGSYSDQFLVTKSLIAAGGDINVQDSDGETPLHHVCQSGDPRFVKFLLGLHARVDIEDNSGKTPYDAAREAFLQGPDAQLYWILRMLLSATTISSSITVSLVSISSIGHPSEDKAARSQLNRISSTELPTGLLCSHSDVYHDLHRKEPHNPVWLEFANKCQLIDASSHSTERFDPSGWFTLVLPNGQPDEGAFRPS